MLLALAPLTLAAAPPIATPWPADTDLVYTFTYAPALLYVEPGSAPVGRALPAEASTWTCRAKPAKRTGRQEMTCHVPNLGDVWMVWGPGRELLALDIDEDDPNADTQALAHRTAILAGALELWPEVPRVSGTWEQRGRFGVLKVAPNTGNSSFQLTHTVAAVDGSRVTITDTGAGTMLAGSGTDLAARVSLVAEGSAVFDTATGLLVERTVKVFPAQIAGVSWGTMGHEVTVRRAP